MGVSVAALTFGEILAGASLAVAVGGAVMQQQAGKKAAGAAAASAAEQRQQFASQQRIADIKNARERAQIARQARVQRGAIASTGALTNTSSSSGVVGGLAGVGTQAASSLGTFGVIEQNQQDINASRGRQGTAQAQQIEAQADISSSQSIFNIGSAVFKEMGGFKTIFDMDTKSTPNNSPIDPYNYSANYG